MFIKYLLKLFLIFIFFGIIITFFSINFIDEIFYIFFKNKYSEVIIILKILILGITFRFLSILCISLLYTSKKIVILSKYWGLITLTKVIFSFLIVYYYDFYLLSYSFIFFEFTLFMIFLILSIKYILYEY